MSHLLHHMSMLPPRVGQPAQHVGRHFLSSGDSINKNQFVTHELPADFLATLDPQYSLLHNCSYPKSRVQAGPTSIGASVHSAIVVVPPLSSIVSPSTESLSCSSPSLGLPKRKTMPSSVATILLPMPSLISFAKKWERCARKECVEGRFQFVTARTTHTYV
jgi:hypothetical protein